MENDNKNLPLDCIANEDALHIAHMLGLANARIADFPAGEYIRMLDDSYALHIFADGQITLKKNREICEINTVPLYQYLLGKGYQIFDLPTQQPKEVSFKSLIDWLIHERREIVKAAEALYINVEVVLQQYDKIIKHISECVANVSIIAVDIQGPVIIEEEQDGYIAVIEGIPGMLATGKTQEEAFCELMTSLIVKIMYDSGLKFNTPIIWKEVNTKHPAMNELLDIRNDLEKDLKMYRVEGRVMITPVADLLNLTKFHLLKLDTFLSHFKLDKIETNETRIITKYYPQATLVSGMYEIFWKNKNQPSSIADVYVTNENKNTVIIHGQPNHPSWMLSDLNLIESVILIKIFNK